MNNSVNIYGLSLYSLAKEAKITEQIYDELICINDILKNQSEYIKILDTAAISGNEKNKLIDNAFGSRVHAYIINFVKILSRKKNMYLFSDCVRIYEKQYRKDNNIETVSITTATELSDEKKEQLTEKLSAIYSKKLIPSFCVNPEVIGGMIVKFENSSIDASIKSRLNEIRKAISNAGL